MSETAKTRIVEAYRSLLVKLGRHPTRSDMLGAKVSRDQIRSHFGSLEQLRAHVKSAHPDSCSGVIDSDIFTEKHHRLLLKDVERYRRFVITTAVVGCRAHRGFLATIQTYCRKNKARLLVIPSADPASVAGWDMDGLLGAENIVFGDVALNNNLFVSAIKLSAKQIDPVTGLSRIGQRDGSFIFASPKQRMRCVPIANHKMPHVLMTTGAITEPNYQTDRFMSDRTGYIAQHDHILGAVVVEIESEEIFHYRQIQADGQGGFVDLGSYYLGSGQRQMRPSALVLGDLHAGESDQTALKAFRELSRRVRPERIVVHDGFSGKSISHWDRNRTLTRARQAETSEHLLADELAQFARQLDDLCGWTDGEIVVVKSNHDEFLDRWIEDGVFVHDPVNYRVALQIANAAMENNDPLQWAVEKIGRLGRTDRIRWLKRDDDFTLAGIQLGAHGDRGPSGSRGTARNLEASYGACVVGHIHTPEILRGCYVVGTCSRLRLPYTVGPSSWMHTSCLVYPNGARQLVNSIEGSWCLKK